jgi:NAD(P)-dependent dehydrogenase (short-subunit alcohol dehydrogenase family)
MDPSLFSQQLEEAVTANGQEIYMVADNIGWSPDTPFADQTPELWTKVIAINLVGCFVSTRAIGDRMIDKGIKGRIVIVTSINGRRTFSSSSAPYDSSKAGQEALVKNEGYRLAPHGVHVNAVAPGWVDTKMNETVTDDDWKVELPKIKSGRQAKPEEIASLIISLSGDASDYVYGTVVDIEGAYY